VTELSNETAHALMHIGWVPDHSGSGYHAQMAVLVKPNGRFGRAYMMVIKPIPARVRLPAAPAIDRTPLAGQESLRRSSWNTSKSPGEGGAWPVPDCSRS
jgi:Protein of unknown function (DUF2867)